MTGITSTTESSGRAPGEWPGGIAPPGSRIGDTTRRLTAHTRREGLPSPGSHTPTCGTRDEVPVSEESGLVLPDSFHPPPAPLGLAAQPIVLLHGSSDQLLVDAQCDEIQLGAVEGSVVADPASDLGVDLPGEVGQVRVTATAEVPGPDLLADRLGRLGAHGRVEAHEQALPAEYRAPPEGVAEEIEADMLRVSPAFRVFAVHDLRLVGVQLEAEGPEPSGDRSPETSGLRLGVAVDDNVIGVPFERAARVFPVHPAVERVMHEKISQQRGNRRSLRSAFLPGHERPVRHLHGGFKPPFDVEQDPAQAGVVSYRLQ